MVEIFTTGRRMSFGVWRVGADAFRGWSSGVCAPSVARARDSLRCLRRRRAIEASVALGAFGRTGG